MNARAGDVDSAVAAESQPGLDVDALSRWLESQGQPGDVRDVEVIAGGTQNLVYRLTVGGQRLVLRRPPLHPRPHSNKAILREMSVLGTLGDSEVPHPEFRLGCEDTNVLGGVVFYLMESVEGVNPKVELCDLYVEQPDNCHAVGLSMASALAKIGSVEPTGLGDGVRFLERQIHNQRKLWRGFVARPDYDASWLPDVERTAEWLLGNLPPASPARLVHGDFSLNNVLLRTDEPRVAAVLDWEMCTAGDPLFDLGWLMLCWPDHDEPAVVPAGSMLTGQPGLPARAEMVQAYVAAGGRSPGSRIDWYAALAAFKLGVLIESSYVRFLDGLVSHELGTSTHELARNLLLAADRLARGRWSVTGA